MISQPERSSAGLTVEWCIVEDTELTWRFTVSPRSGAMVALPPQIDVAHVTTRTALRVHGLRPAEQRERLHCDDTRQGPVGESDGATAPARRTALHARWALCAMLARRMPLRTALTVLARLPAGSAGWGHQEILDRIANVERQRHPQLHTRQCLPRALLRFWMLLPHERRVEFNLGVWVPTQLMHAWVSLGTVPFGEEREEVMHYRPCVRMTWARDEH